ncbi:NLR family CARD domain-containing protein 3-like [Chanos chanos]|uniref:NLR family CARD domain-containing protein 3-like n=1 Tax=Chanos chanos TaxID=29144 RepID=A0A6J2VYU0_CHACN|nr:NLR family CARD domain-containing protein 3-like [Chanos chanos]
METSASIDMIKISAATDGRSSSQHISGGGCPGQDQSRCGLCEQVLRDPVSTSCGHSFCRQCISTYWDQSGPSGDYVCPQCRKRSRTRPALQQPKVSDSTSDPVLLRFIDSHKTILKNKYRHLFEGVTPQGHQTFHSRIYISEGESEGVSREHEVLQIDTASRAHGSDDISVNLNDIFKPSSTQEPTGSGGEIKTVLTMGFAGVGKTATVQRFILDWAEGKANEDIDFMFVLPFKELNVIKDDQYSLHGLLQEFHPELRELDPKKIAVCKTVLILDGLDESVFYLDFSQRFCDMTAPSTVAVLLANLIQGNLLPSALIWITCRPAAASEIPSKCISRVTNIQGFNDSQKEEYIRERVSDQSQADRIISHIKSSRSLHVMCHIPVFCWMSVTVLQEMLHQDHGDRMPKTLTEMYTHFLLVQMNTKNRKYEGKHETNPTKLLESSRAILLKLAEFAFKQLLRGCPIFYEEDLTEHGIDVSKATGCSGICAEIFTEESVLRQKKVYCFRHLSVQEFFAAVYAFHCYVSKNMEPLQYFLWGKSKGALKKVPLDVLLKGAVTKACESKDGHLDLFIRFLHGMSLESNQKLIQGLLAHTENDPESIKKAVRNLRGLQKKSIQPERWVNLLHCLTEMNDYSAYEEIQALLKSKKSKVELTAVQCTALVYLLQTSEEVLEEFDVKKYSTSDEGRRRLFPVLGFCRKALLSNCQLSTLDYETLVSALQSSNSSLRELDLSNSDLQDSGVKRLCAGLEDPHCKLEILRLSDCKLTEQSCKMVASVLQLADSCLRELDLSNNELQDSGVKLLSAGLENQNCKLEILRLSCCLVTEEGCSSLASALSSNPSHLRELDLSYNHPGDLGAKLLSARLEDPHCNLETLNLDHAVELRKRQELKEYACELTLDPNTAYVRLCLSEGNRKVTYGNIMPYPDHPERFENCVQVLCRESLTGRCYWEAEWSGKETVIGVTYKGIDRKGWGDDSWLGLNDKSWGLLCSSDSYTARHNKQSAQRPAPKSQHRRVGVYLDWPAGTLSFYSVSSDTHTLTHIHTFHCTFTEPLYAGFWIFCCSFLSVCKMV